MISKFKQYTIGELIKIVPHQILYKALLFKEKLLVKYFPSQWPVCLPKKILDCDKFIDFYMKCDDSIVKICKKADQILDGYITVFNKKYYFDNKKDWLKDPCSQNFWSATAFCMTAPVFQSGCKDVKYVLEVNKMNQLVEVALAYYHTNDSKYIEYIDESIKKWKENVIPGRSIANRIMMDLGFRIINFIQVILLCYKSDIFKKQVLPHILGIIKEHIDRIYLFSTPRWFKTGNGQNHITGEMIGLILGQQCLESFGVRSYKKYYKKEYKYLVEVLDRTIAPSGAYLEQSSNYARVVAEFMVCFDMFRKAFNNVYIYPNYEKGEYTKRLMDYLDAINYHDYLPNFGDNDDARVLLAFKKEGQVVNYLFNKYFHKYDNDNYLDGSQWLYRSKDKNDIFVFTRIGKFTNVKELAGTHAHNDILSINLGIKGRPIFIDKGCRYYNSGNDIIKEDRSVASHNSVSIENIELNNIYKGFYSEYPVSECIVDIKEDDKCKFCGKLNYRNIEHTRTINYSRDTIIIEDDIYVNDNVKRKGKLRYMVHPNIIIEQMDGYYILKEDKRSKIAKIMIDMVDSSNINKEEYSPSYANVEETNVIEAIFDVNNNRRVKTIIELENN